MFAGWRPCGGKAWSSAQVTATGLLVRDHLERAGQFEAVQRSQSPARITVLSWQSLDELPGASGATWLDKQLVARSPEMIASRELGAEVEVALRSRRQWLLEEGLCARAGRTDRLRAQSASSAAAAGTSRSQRARHARDRS
jgi:Protein of unknown function (DUF3363)